MRGRRKGLADAAGGSEGIKTEFVVFAGPALNAAKFTNVCCQLVAA